jgi:hypothetical protein
MKRLKWAGILLGMLLGLALTATSALAAVTLPDISVTLTGGVYPIHAQGSTKATTETSLSTTGGGVLNGTGATLLLLAIELSALGTFTADFTHVENPEKVKCHSVGDAEGVVLVSGEAHLVPISLSPVMGGALMLVTEFEVECPAGINVIVRGNVLASINNVGSEGTELTGVSGALKGEKGKQAISEYYNDGGTKIKTKLESEAGAGFTKSAMNVEEEVPLQILGSQMVVVTGR